MRRWLHEPLLHFLLLGLALFGAFRVFAPPEPEPPGSIVVTRGAIAGLVAGFARTWQRAPTPEELAGLVREHVREELYYREALALGLDRDDTIVRRRMRQKLEFLAEAEGLAAEPGDEELRAHLRAHADAYRSEGRISFLQVRLDAERRGARAAADLERLLGELRAGTADPAALGDASLLERSLADAAFRDVARQFGEAFAARLRELPIGSWQGPVESPFGVHAVLVQARSDARTPQLDEVRDAVRRDWLEARRQAASEEHYQALLRRYTVTIEPAPAAEPAAAGGTAAR